MDTPEKSGATFGPTPLISKLRPFDVGMKIRPISKRSALRPSANRADGCGSSRSAAHQLAALGFRASCISTEADRRHRWSGFGSGLGRGYVCTSYDFTGPWAGRKDVTDWGPITQANLAQANGGLQVRPTPHASSWYHWAVVARRALTLLSYHPKVDRDRLGIFGVSIGGTLCWLVAATDDRVKTAVPIYGCGYNYDRRKTAWGFPDLDPDLRLFKQVLAPDHQPGTEHSQPARCGPRVAGLERFAARRTIGARRSVRLRQRQHRS